MDTSVGGRRGRFWGLLVVIGMIAGLVFTIPAIDAQGDVNDPVKVDAGIILLGTDVGQSWVRYYENPTAPLNLGSYDKQQILNVDNKCKVTSTGDTILTLAETGGNRIAMVSNGLGVSTKNNCSTSEGRISAGQKLTFALASGLFDQNTFVDIAEIDVEGKFGSELFWTVSDGTATESKETDLFKSADNGPDSGASDNEIAVVDPSLLFRSITLEPTNGGEVSIEGGGDGLVTGGTLRGEFGVNKTLFKLVEVYDDEIDCDSGEVAATQEADSPWADTITLWRGNDDKGGNCATLPFSFRNETGHVLFDAVFDAAPNATFLIKIEWDPDNPTVDPFNPPDREIDFEIDGNFVTVSACEKLVSEGDPEDSTFVDDPDPDIDDVYQHPKDTDGNIIPWCLAGERLVLGENGLWQQIQWYDGAGDPNWR